MPDRQTSGPVSSGPVFGANFKRLRQALRVTAVEVAKRAGWSPSQLSKLENGQIEKIDLFDALMLASLIRVPLEDLVAGAELALPQPIFDQDYPAQQILDSESSQLPKSKRGFFQALLYRVGPGIVESMAEDVITNVDVDKRLLRFIGDWEQLSEPQKQLLVAMIEQFSPS